MMEILHILAAPFAAAVVLVLLHAYLGSHVLRRGVIFVDLAMAQFAALGAAVGTFFGLEFESFPAYLLGLGTALFAAALFAVSRRRIRRVPQEAIIGSAYVTASAAAILLADRMPHGSEHVKEMLVGAILWVGWPEVLRVSVLYAVLGLALRLLHDRLDRVSRETAGSPGSDVVLWDFVFYAIFAVVVSVSVRIAGVLLVFTILIMPSVLTSLLGVRAGRRLPVAWTAGILLCLTGMLVSYWTDFPTGATIVVVFGVATFATSLVVRARPAGG